MKVLKNLDYVRVLYVRNQVSKCKTIIMNSIREGCPSLYKKYKESRPNLLESEKKLDGSERIGDVIVKKVKPL